MITVEYLKQEISNLENQKKQAEELIQQAIGAIGLCRSLIDTLENKKELTFEELKNGLNASSIEVD